MAHGPSQREDAQTIVVQREYKDILLIAESDPGVLTSDQTMIGFCQEYN